MNKEDFLRNFTFSGYEKIDPVLNYGISGICKIVYGLVGFSVCERQKKDGTGEFYVSPSVSVTRNSSKEYEDGFWIDSRSMSSWFFDWVRENVKRRKLEGGGSFIDDNTAPF